MFFINWVILSFATVVDYFKDFFAKFSQKIALIMGFVLLQLIVLLTTCAINLIQYWAARSGSFSDEILFHGTSLHLGYGVLLGAFCLRYLYDDYHTGSNSLPAMAYCPISFE